MEKIQKPQLRATFSWVRQVFLIRSQRFDSRVGERGVGDCCVVFSMRSS